MPLAIVHSNADPTRAVVMRSLRWWWVGVIVAVVVCAGYYSSASRSASTAISSTGNVWADNPPAFLQVAPMLAETLAVADASGDLPDSVSISVVADHLVVAVSGAADDPGADYEAAVAALDSAHRQIVSQRVAPQLAGAEAQLASLKQRSAALSAAYADIPESSPELRQLALLRIMVAEDAVSTQEGIVADLSAQSAASNVRPTPLVTSESVTAGSGGGKFDLAMGMFFGLVLGAVAMLALGSLDRRVRGAAGLSRANLGQAVVVECRSSTLVSDAMLLAAATPSPAPDVRLVVLSSVRRLPEPILSALSGRHASVQVVDATPDALADRGGELPSVLDGAATVVAIELGRTSEEHAAQLVELAQGLSSELVAVTLVPKAH